jgi:hypothetical protein
VKGVNFTRQGRNLQKKNNVQGEDETCEQGKSCDARKNPVQRDKYYKFEDPSEFYNPSNKTNLSR